MRAVLAAMALLCLGPGSALSEGRSFVLAADAGLAETGLLKFVVPRFALKHGIRPTLVTGPMPETAEGADLVITLRDAAQALVEAGAGGAARAVFYTETDPPQSYALVALDGGANTDHAGIFAEWLRGEIGQRTVASFAAEGQPAFVPGALKVVVETVIEPTGDANVGEKLALLHCGRCHVVSEKNRMGGIGSTPSFAALRSLEGWEDKFLAFWAANPHPSFTQVAGLTEPFDPDHPPHIAPVEITQDDVEAIFAYAATIEPKNLGAPIASR